MSKNRGNFKIQPIEENSYIFPLEIDKRIGIVSDTHFGSKYAAYGKLGEFYDHVDELGIKQVFHAGDITDGTYDGRLGDLEFVGSADQANKVIRDYPRKKGVETFVIMGNHDSLYLRRDGVDIMEKIASARPDLKDCGTYYARFVDEDRNIKLDLQHPSSVKTYAISYGAQSYLRGLPPSQRPDILIRGHMHQSWFGQNLGVLVFEAGCFINPSKHLSDMGYENTVGGWIAQIDSNDRRIKSVKTEWFQGKAHVTRTANKFKSNTSG
ncbi:MAG: metallophosphoesterase [Candidatus Aenigmatarchaeota archaeon]